MTGAYHVTFCSFRPRHRRFTHEMLPLWTSAQIRWIKRTAYVFFYLIMITSSAFAYSRPRVAEDKNRTVVIFKNSPCRPLTTSQLSSRMGEAFDESRMAAYKMSEDSVKRSVDPMQGPSRANNDQPVDDESFGEEERKDDAVASDGGAEEEAADLDPDDPERVSRLHKRENGSGRKRFSRRRQQNAKQLKLYLLMVRRGESANRRKRNILALSQAPWECKMQTVWQEMKEEYFPSYIQTGRCLSKSCFYNLYNCIPRKYTIKVLKRDPNRCNPVPTYGADTVYEEKWIFERHHVTVCCECGQMKSKKRPRRWQKKRRRHR